MPELLPQSVAVNAVDHQNLRSFINAFCCGLQKQLDLEIVLPHYFS